jgi:NAD(P)H-flavin reductase
LRGLAFDAGELEARHTRPGQYVKIVDKPYALASEPGAAEMELLFKNENERTDAMAALVPGDEIVVAAPQGRGFPIEEHEGRDVILCAAGSGIAPLRAVVRTILPRRPRYGAVTLFYGQRHDTHFAYVGEHDAWRAAGVDVVLVVSDASAQARGAYERGRVQDVVAAHAPRTENAVAYLAGMKGMIAAMHAALAALKLPEARIFLNY